MKLSFRIKFGFLRFLLVFSTKSSSFLLQILVFSVKVSTFIAIYYIWVKFDQKELVLIKFGSKIWCLKADFTLLRVSFDHFCLFTRKIVSFAKYPNFTRKVLQITLKLRISHFLTHKFPILTHNIEVTRKISVLTHKVLCLLITFKLGQV